MSMMFPIPRTLKEVQEYRNSMEVTVKGHDIPYPIQYFEEGNFPAYIFYINR
jgi:ATP-dependent RNA helicase DDX5/DBP2